MRTSAFVGVPNGNSPVTRKQTSLFWAANNRSDRRFSRLHELFKWDVWLHEAAIKVLRQIYPNVSVQEKYAELIVKDLLLEFKSKNKPLDEDSFNEVHLWNARQSARRIVLGMALEPIWRAKTGAPWEIQDLENWQKSKAGEILDALEEDAHWQWAVVFRCFPAAKNLCSKPVLRSLRCHISDKTWLNAVHREIRRGIMKHLDSFDPLLCYDRELAWLLLDVTLTPLDEMLKNDGMNNFCSPVPHDPGRKVLPWKYFRQGAEIICLVPGDLEQAQAVEEMVLAYLRETIGLSGVESEIYAASENVRVFGMELVQKDSVRSRTLKAGKERIAWYRSMVRELTSSSNIGKYGADVVVLMLDRLMREWCRNIELFEGKGLLEAFDTWTERKVFRFLQRFYPGRSNKYLLKRFYGRTDESVVADQKIKKQRSIKIEINEASAIFFLDRLRRFKSFKIFGLYTHYCYMDKYYPQCAICAGTHRLSVCLADERRPEAGLEDFIILCRNCFQTINGCSKWEDSGEPDAVKAARPVRREVPEDTV